MRQNSVASAVVFDDEAALEGKLAAKAARDGPSDQAGAELAARGGVRCALSERPDV